MRTSILANLWSYKDDFRRILTKHEQSLFPHKPRELVEESADEQLRELIANIYQGDENCGVAARDELLGELQIPCRGSRVEGRQLLSHGDGYTSGRSVVAELPSQQLWDKLVQLSPKQDKFAAVAKLLIGLGADNDWSGREFEEEEEDEGEEGSDEDEEGSDDE